MEIHYFRYFHYTRSYLDISVTSDIIQNILAQIVSMEFTIHTNYTNYIEIQANPQPKTSIKLRDDSNKYLLTVSIS